jgi:hypothetical protein
LVREPAFVPPHYSGQILLTHLPFADAGETGQDSKIGTGKSSAFRKVLCDAAHHLVAHDLPSRPTIRIFAGLMRDFLLSNCQEAEMKGQPE